MSLHVEYYQMNYSSANESSIDYGYIDPDNLWADVLDDFKKSQLTLHEPVTIILLILYVPIFVTSLVGNILVLLVIVPNQRMWTVTNNFLVNLAVADLLVTVLCMPMTMAGKVYKLWVYGDVLCKMTPYLQGVSVTTSTFTITAMSLDRCLAILYPVKFRNLRTKRNVRTLIVLVWLTSFLLMIPLLFVNKTKTQTVFNNFKIVICSEEWTSVYQRRAYDFSLLFIVCLIPAQIVFVSYVLMGKRLWVTDSALKANTSSKAVGSTRGSSHGPYDSVRASRRRTAKMCIVVSVVFVVCWLPYYTVNIYLDFKRDEGLLDIVYWGLFIGHLHCITNPILYCFMHKTFRYCVKRMLPCWRKSFVRTPSGYGTNAGNRMGSLVTSTRRACPAGERTHARLSQSCSASSSTSTATQPETSPVHGHDIKPPPRRVRLILMKLKRRRLCKKSSNDSFKLVDIPSSITEEAPIETVT